MHKSPSRKIALCGVLGALSVVVMLLGAALQIGTYAAPMFAAFLLVPVLEEYGIRYALLLYATTSVLGILLVPEPELSLFYTLVIGYYPVLRHLLRKVHPAVLRGFLKCLLFNLTTALVYLLLSVVVGPAVLQEFTAEGTGVLVLLLAMGNFAFFLCDRALGAVTLYYRRVLRKRWKHFL